MIASQDSTTEKNVDKLHQMPSCIVVYSGGQHLMPVEAPP